MKIARVSAVACALLGAYAPLALAQRWGGSPPPPAHPAVVAPLVYTVPVIVVGQDPFAYAYVDNLNELYWQLYARRYMNQHHQQRGDTGTRPTNGGSWDGSRPPLGGPPPARPAEPAPNYREFFGYVAPRDTAPGTPVAAPRRTRDVYRERFGKP